MTYAKYCTKCYEKRIQPLSMWAFDKLIIAGFDFNKGTF